METVIPDGVVNLVKKEGVTPDNSAQDSNKDPQYEHGGLHLRDDSAIQETFPGEDHGSSRENGDNAHVYGAYAEKWKMVFLFHGAKVQ